MIAYTSTPPCLLACQGQTPSSIFVEKNPGSGQNGQSWVAEAVGSSHMPPASCAGAGRIHTLDITKGVGFPLWVEGHHPASLC